MGSNSVVFMANYLLMYKELLFFRRLLQAYQLAPLAADDTHRLRPHLPHPNLDVRYFDPSITFKGQEGPPELPETLQSTYNRIQAMRALLIAHSFKMSGRFVDDLLIGNKKFFPSFIYQNK
jgi:hypothetical protein